ncbi:glycoprotein [Striga asiatica]|uniref:Glycoprotein n=1 Tax=Striga asiatica TaxID=4170 RepID=A0A5A7QFV2_STRAF|nr:glycoprotein [Striga asiatica]
MNPDNLITHSIFVVPLYRNPCFLLFDFKWGQSEEHAGERRNARVPRRSATTEIGEKIEGRGIELQIPNWGKFVLCFLGDFFFFFSSFSLMVCRENKAIFHQRENKKRRKLGKN